MGRRVWRVSRHDDGTVKDVIDYGESKGLSYAGVFEGPDDLGTRSEKHLAEHFSQADAAS